MTPKSSIVIPIHSLLLIISFILVPTNAFSPPTGFHVRSPCSLQAENRNDGIGSNKSTDRPSSDSDALSGMATSRFPNSVEDQVRQATISIRAASQDGIHRHSVRLLLPIIGATELDDWPGGARQMMEAAFPLVKDIMTQLPSAKDSYDNKKKSIINESVIDQADGVRAMFMQASTGPEDDSLAVLLPSADTVEQLKKLDMEVGPDREYILVNSQWVRKTDFGGFFGMGSSDSINFVENFQPIFHCTNVMVEGDIVRILRTYPGPWRVYLRNESNEDGKEKIDWIEIGTKDVMKTKTSEWQKSQMKNINSDGEKLFDFGKPTYENIREMIVSWEGYVPKSLSERASAAFTFIKDTL